ncbi:MAG: DNA polymerase I [Salinivirgaceae bacterium]|nr:DNA polymerase I [Salinivirgaceae bacterium]
MSEKKLFLLDAYALAYRAYYAFINNPRINSKGDNTSAVFGFANAILEVITKQKPSHIGVVFDPKGPTFRHEMFKEYKANREAMPEDLRKSIPWIKEMIDSLNVPVVEIPTFEADDVIGTLAKKAEKEGFQVFMMTPDKDYAQLVSDNIFVFKPARNGNDAEVWDREKVHEKFKVYPENIIDLLGIMGDSSDNIPGCPGVGPKGAEKLISAYGSLEGIYENIEELKGKQKENFINFKDQIELSKILATIEINVPVEFNANDYIVESPDVAKVTELFNRLEFNNLIDRVLGTKESAPSKPAGVPFQASLFDAPVEAEEKPVDNLKNLASLTFDYKIVSNEKEQLALVQELLKSEQVCFDTETTSLVIHSAELVGLALSTNTNKAWYIPFPDNFEEAKIIIERFNPFFKSKKVLKVGQNLKYDIMVLMNYGVEVEGPFFDTMIAHYLIQPDFRHNLDDLAKNYLNYNTIKTEALIGKKGKNQISMRQVPLELLKNYACEDADITLQLMPFLQKELEKANMLELFNTIEIPLINVLAKVEYQGVTLDKESLADFSKSLVEDILKVEQRIYKHAGVEFNIASPKQMGEVLFDQMKIISDPKKTKTKQYATGEDVLSKIKDKHPIIEEILEYRSLRKLLSTYVDALPLLIHSKTGRIHTSYNQTITSTGRLSSNNPNLQNIPIREARGREIRKSFIPCDGDHILLAADYSQIELRIMAHLCEDEHMIEAFKNGEDIHSATAARIFKVDKKEVTREQRGNAKGANFGIIYGISSFGLSQNLNISRSDAKSLIDNYFESYPGVKIFMDQSIAIVRENGFAETIFGRRRYLSDIQSNNAIVRGGAERNAINAPIQGAAADIIKIAMIRIQKRFEKEDIQSKMILQVHDELVFDVLKAELEKVKEIVIYEMENVTQLKVPLTVDFGVGENWLQAH